MGECARYYRDAVPVVVWDELRERLIASGRERAAFPGAESCTREYFFDLVFGENTHAWLLTFRGELAGMFYLTDMEGTSTRAHFAFLPLGSASVGAGAERLPAAVALGRFCVASVLRDRYEDSEDAFVLDTLIGLTPASNPSAVKLARRCGGQVLGTLPAACYVDGQPRNVDGVVSYFTRNSTRKAWMQY